MSIRPSSVTLEQFFRRQSLRWAWLGLASTLLIAVPCMLLTSKLVSERQVTVLAEAAVRAFRPMILEGNARDAQFQMVKALSLRPGERAIIRDEKLNPIYTENSQGQEPQCRLAGQYCWRSWAVSFLQPIYFDDEHREGLYGYLELTIKPSLDWKVASAGLFLLLATLAIQALWLNSGLNRSAALLRNSLEDWAKHLRSQPQSQANLVSAPFRDLVPMEDAIGNLHLEIARLRAESADQAKADAQLSMLREVSHDLKTPHSLLARYFALHLDTVETTGKADPKEVGKFTRTLRRMGDLLRQIGMLSTDSGRDEVCDIGRETIALIEDLRQIPEVLEKGIQILGSCEDNQAASIAKVAYYRILENLVRNAAEAASVHSGQIAIATTQVAGKPALVVQDNGPGISEEIRQKIFDFDFTSKPGRGTGLGLGIVKRICDQVGAEIHLESTVGVGTSFVIRFRPSEVASVAVRNGEVPYVQA